MIGKRWFWAATALLLAAMGAAQVTSALQETQTWTKAYTWRRAIPT